jgi:2-polyprenyl-3-methyl-5-hydroxy-6-metoxy-1,4-benzoquinol methylase
MYIKPLKNYDKYVERQNDRSHANFNSNSFLNDVDVKKIDKSAYILDIGCRNASVLSSLYSMGFRNVFGMDIGKNAANHRRGLEFIKNLIIHDVHLGIPFEFTFDVIMISHVLEHLYDPIKCSEIIKNKLSPTGILYSVVPLEHVSQIFSGETEERPNPHYVSFETCQEHVDFWIKSGFYILSEGNHKNLEHRLVGKLI